MRTTAKNGLPMAVFFFAFFLLSQQPAAQVKGGAGDIVRKYSLQLSADETHVQQFKSLYSFIDSWLGVPYLWGGCDRRGIDCSCFVKTLFNQVFNIGLQRTSFTQFYDNDVSLFKNAKQYSTGDLIFFKTAINRETRRNRITHVGIYLINDFFVQSSSGGVNIASLKNSYWRSSMVAAGRLKESYYRKAGLKVQAASMDYKDKYVVEENSTFDPPVLAERYDSIIKKYSLRLGVQGEEITVPELFAFLDSIEQNSYQPACPSTVSASDCLVTDLYKTVFGQEIDAKEIAVQNSSLIKPLKQSGERDLGDVVFFKAYGKQKTHLQSGILLLNDFVAFVDSGKLKIEPLLNISRRSKLKVVEYNRINSEILKAGYNHLMQGRWAEDSLARMMAINGPVPQPKTAATAATVPSIPIQPTSKPLSEWVQSVSVPFQETKPGEYPEITVAYAREMNVHPFQLNRTLLYAFANHWRNKSYKKGSCTDKKIGYECFVTKYFAEVHDKTISIKNLSDLNGAYVQPLTNKDVLLEGDLLFFGKRTEAGLEVLFTGIYLSGSHFLSLNPQTKKVSLCRTDDPVYEDLFLAAGRPQ